MRKLLFCPFSAARSHPASDADSAALHLALGVGAAPLRLDLEFQCIC